MKNDPHAVASPKEILDYGTNIADAVAALPRINLDDSSAGIYFLFMDEKCIYVGQSRRIHMRIHEHRHTKRHHKTFDSYAWVICPVGDLNRLERFYIDALKPSLNVTFTERNIEVAQARVKRRREKRYDARHSLKIPKTTIQLI